MTARPLSPGRLPRRTRPGSRARPRRPRFLELVTERTGPLASIPLHRVAGIAAEMALLAGLNTGSARAAGLADAGRACRSEHRPSRPARLAYRGLGGVQSETAGVSVILLRFCGWGAG